VALAGGIAAGCGTAAQPAPSAQPVGAGQQAPSPLSGGSPAAVENWLAASVHVTNIRQVSSREVTGTWRGYTVVCVATSASEILSYGVSASSAVGPQSSPWQCGVKDDGTPDQAVNSGFGWAMGTGMPAPLPPVKS
jgi:hypothetical protein